MVGKQVFILLSIVYLVKAGDLAEFTNQGIPDIIDDVPKELAEVVYVTTNVSADTGNEIKPNGAQIEPLVKWSANNDTSYTIVMVDPDEPSRDDPSLRSILHWLVGNIPGGNITAGDCITDYLGPAPTTPQGGLHRYASLFTNNLKQRLTTVN